MKTLINFLLFVFLITNLNAEVIKDVKISGNKRISNETIKVFTDIKVGKDFTDFSLNQALKKLYDSNFFEDVTLSFNNGLLQIAVVENPIIDTFEIEGIKNKTFLEFIKESLSLRERTSFNSVILQNDLNIIKNILQTNGYYFSNIKSNFIKNDELNSLKLKIDIDLGDKARIKEIIFIGDKKVKDKKLLEIIASEKHMFWKFISKNVFLNQNTISLDKRLLSNYYKNLGYYNVKILDAYAEITNESSNFKLTYKINAGKKYFFNDFSLIIPPDYYEKDFDYVNERFDEIKGDPFSLKKVNKILDEIESIATNRLYDFIDAIVTEEIVNDNKLNFTFTLKDSEKFYVEKVNIFGNFTTIEDVIRNRLIVDEGDPLNKILFNKSINEIKSLNIFKKVEYKVNDGSTDNQKIIDINVEEQPTGEISLAAGYGTSGAETGGSITEKNFMGKGINLNASLQLSEDSLKGELNYIKPNFAYTDNTLIFSLKSIENDFLSIYGYETSEKGFSVGTIYEQYENLFFSPEIRVNFEDLTTNSTASANLKKQEGSYNDLYFNYGLNYDLRDSKYKTSSGKMITFNQDLPLISDGSEISNALTYNYYKTLNETSNMVGKANFLIQSVNSVDGSDVRISKRVNAPYHRLRGFEKGKIGPVDKNDYIGGNYASVINLSTNLPGILSSVDIVDFNYFIDLANVWGVDYNDSLSDSKLRSSTGIGMNFLTPIGPLSFSLSQPITKSSSDKTETFRFSLGTTF